MTKSLSVTPLTEELAQGIRRHWCDQPAPADPQVIRQDFERFATQAVSRGVSLEEAMAAASVAVNQALIEINKLNGESDAHDICGIGLGAIARIYLSPTAGQEHLRTG